MQPRTKPLVYLAARYSRREELRGYAAQLEELGLASVPARWLHEDHDWDGTTEEEGLLRAQGLALDDLEDVWRAHALVLFTEEAGQYRRGGSLVELGFALGKGKHVVIVGPAPNVFCTLASIVRVATWTDAVAHLVEWRRAVESAATRKALLQ